VVAPIGVDKAATAVTQAAEKLSPKSDAASSQGGAGGFEQLLAQQPQQATASSAADAASAAAPVSGSTAASAVSASQAATSTKPLGLGDKILSGIDKARGEVRDVAQQVGKLDETGTNRVGQMSDLIKIQASMVGFEVTTQVAGKGMQETSSAVQTLLKGGGS
jgi:hypothetical protein